MSLTPPSDRPRMDHAPSERFQTTDVDAPAPSGSVVRTALATDAVAFGGVVAAVVLGGILALSAGLLVVWATTGYLIGVAARIGGGTRVTPVVRQALAVISALAGVVLGQIGLWWYAGLEGGVLPIVDYLAQTYGVLVPLQAVLAGAMAWWNAR